jgi:hypothetical protein
LTAAISRAVYHSVRNIDISEVQDTKTETDEENKEEDEEKGSDIIAEEKDIGLFNYNLIKIIMVFNTTFNNIPYDHDYDDPI